MHDIKEKINDICEMKKTLVSFVKSHMDNGLSGIDTHELGEAIDMIKDCTEMERNCYEACYYKSIVEAMDEAEQYGNRMGYNPNRNRIGQYSDGRADNNGDRSMPRPQNGRRGYMPDPRMFADEYWMDERENRMNQEDPDRDRYGRPFSEYRKAKRYYTENHSEAEHKKMRDSANEHVMSAVASLREIWEDADPDLRMRMKNDMQKLVEEMK